MFMEKEMLKKVWNDVLETIKIFIDFFIDVMYEICEIYYKIPDNKKMDFLNTLHEEIKK